MPTFACKVMASSGAMENSNIEAASEAQARAMLQSRGKVVLRLKEVSGPVAASSRTRRGKGVSQDEVANTIRQLSVLIRAGVPLVEGLRSLAEQTKSANFSRCLNEVAEVVNHGGALSDAFAAYPNIFPALAVDMARIAEAGGDLSGSMSRLAEHLEKSAEIRRKVKAALAYPLVVVCISAVTVLVLVGFVLPKFMKLFSRMGADVPWTTNALMSLSRLVVEQWYILLIGTVVVVYVARRYLSSPAGKRHVDILALKLPVISDVVNKIILSRVLASMATLLSTGVPMIQALETSASAANNEVVKQALLSAKRQVSEGKDTSQALRESGVFPSLVLQMVASGEKTGELPSMLDHICFLYNQDADTKVKSLTSVIEPVLIVFLGVVVGFIAISVILPIYSLVGGAK